MTNPPIQKALESFEEKFEKEYAEVYRYDDWPGNVRWLKDKLTTTIEEIAQAEYARGLESARVCMQKQAIYHYDPKDTDLCYEATLAAIDALLNSSEK